jgi:hypothetical protein
MQESAGASAGTLGGGGRLCKVDVEPKKYGQEVWWPMARVKNCTVNCLLKSQLSEPKRSVLRRHKNAEMRSHIHVAFEWTGDNSLKEGIPRRGDSSSRVG